MIFRIIVLMIMIMPIAKTIAQNPTYYAVVTNDSLISPTEYIFDVYLLSQGTPFELSSVQMGIKFDSIIQNGRRLQISLVPGYSDIDSIQRQTNANLTIVPLSSIVEKKTIKVVAKTAPSGSGTIITSNPSIRVFRLKLTDSIPFFIAKPNLTWSFELTNSWPTQVNAYLNLISTNITDSISHQLATDNPILNKPIEGFTLTQAGPTLTFNGSETGVRYHLIKDGIAQTDVISGTASPITWNITYNGIYQVAAHRIATYIDTIFSNTIAVSSLIDNIEMNNATNNAISVYANNNSIFIQNRGTENIREIIVYNLSGQSVIRTMPDKRELIQLPMKVSSAQYIVRIITDGQAYSKKVYLK